MRAEPDTPEGCCDDLPAGHKCQESCERRIQNDETALNVDVGYYFNFTVDLQTGRPGGCTAFQPRKNGQDWTKSKVVDCDLNNYAPEGEPLYQIMEDFADHQTHWIRDYLVAYDKMSRNGNDDLTDGPTQWFGAECKTRRVKGRGKVWFCQ